MMSRYQLQDCEERVLVSVSSLLNNSLVDRVNRHHHHCPQFVTTFSQLQWRYWRVGYLQQLMYDCSTMKKRLVKGLRQWGFGAKGNGSSKTCASGSFRKRVKPSSRGRQVSGGSTVPASHTHTHTRDRELAQAHTGLKARSHLLVVNALVFPWVDYVL